MNGLQLYGRLVAASIRSQMQYKTSFLMMTFGQFMMTVIEIFGIYVLFERFGKLGTWTLPEVAMFYGVVHVAFAIAEGASRGFDTFGNMVKAGNFDRILLRPRSTALMIAGQEIQLMRLGRLIQGLIVLVIAWTALDLHWSPAKLLLLMFTIFGGACLFYGLIVLQATMCFWTTETLELMNTLTYGGTEAAQYPMSIYRKWFRSFFTFIVPLACVTYFPVVEILGVEDAILHSVPPFRWLAPGVGVLFLLFALKVWHFGVRHYRSTGS